MEKKSAQKDSGAWILIVLLLNRHFTKQKLEPIERAMQILKIGYPFHT
jgi:hypothetical protein